MRKQKKTLAGVALITPLLAGALLLSVGRSTYAEQTPNPFGGVDSQTPPPPPANPPPPDGAPEVGDDFLDSPSKDGNGAFGFGNQPPQPATAPPDIPNYPPPSNTPAPNTPSRRTTQPSSPRPPVTPPASNTASNKPTQAKAAKLADYLELDSSVKGLEVKNFDLPDKDIKDVVTLISKWTGKNFILDSKVRGKITIMGPSQVTLQEAYQAFLSALDANGLTTVQNGKFIRIIESAEARRMPVKTYAGDYAPRDDQFITRIFQLKYINADEVQREFRDLTTRQGKLFAYEPTNSIIITDTGSNIQRIKEIVEVLDVKSFETTLHVFKVKNTSAKAISEMLGEIYGDDKKGAGGARTFRRSALERTRGGGIITKIIPDEQTNSLVVLANQAGFEQLKQLVGKLDIKVTDTGRIHVYYCEYAKAEDLASTLASLSGGGAGGQGKSTNRKTSVTTPGGPAGGPAAPSIPSGPVTAELEGGIKITSDAATNALVITANASDYQTIKRVIKKLDIPRLQVFVETAILEVALDNDTNVGINLAAGAPGRGFAGGFVGDSANLIKVLSGTGVPDGATIPIFAGPSFQASVPTGTGGQTQNFTVSAFMGLLNLLTKNTNTSVLSTPQIIALDNEKAEFKVQDEIPVQSGFTALAAGASTGLPGGTATGSIDRLKTGIEIKLTPHVNAASRNVRLEIEQTVNSTKANTSVPAALQGIQVATTSRVTNTSVVVRDSDFVMLGGLMSDKVDDSVTKVPLLGDIPILGWLFKSKGVKTVKTNLVILLHPRIIGTSLDSADLVDEKLRKRDQFIDKNVATGDKFPEQMGELKAKIKAQQNRGSKERGYDYRNNDEPVDSDNNDNNDSNERTRAARTSPRSERQSRRESSPEQTPLMPQPDGSSPAPGGGANAPGPASSEAPDAQLLETLEGK